VLLLDEPLGALDAKIRKQLRLELKALQEEVGITFVFVTHDQEEALSMSDRIAVMQAGKVEQLGTPEELYDRPATPFVADFIGTTNLLHGVVEGLESDSTVVRLASGDLCRVATLDRARGQAIDLSLRPEAIRIEGRNGEPAGQPADGLAGTVDQVAYLGSAVQYQVSTGGGLVLSVLAGKNGTRYARGDEVELAWSPSEALVLGERPASKEERT